MESLLATPTIKARLPDKRPMTVPRFICYNIRMIKPFQPAANACRARPVRDGRGNCQAWMSHQGFPLGFKDFQALLQLRVFLRQLGNFLLDAADRAFTVSGSAPDVLGLRH